MPKPTRPLSAYNLFFKYYRERLLADGDNVVLRPRDITADLVLRLSREHKMSPKRAHRKSHGKITFNDLTRKIARSWKHLPLSSKKFFEDQAVLEKDEYHKKLRDWKAQEKHSESSEHQHQQHHETHGSCTSSEVGLLKPASKMTFARPVPFKYEDRYDNESPPSTPPSSPSYSSVSSSEWEHQNSWESPASPPSIIDIETSRLRNLRSQVDAALAGLARGNDRQQVLSSFSLVSAAPAYYSSAASARSNTNQNDSSSLYPSSSTPHDMDYTAFLADSELNYLLEPIDAEVLDHIFD
ncbi:hypothetical protein ACA910_009763 [Epithemia clementina (nom. ined.)]